MSDLEDFWYDPKAPHADAFLVLTSMTEGSRIPYEITNHIPGDVVFHPPPPHTVQGSDCPTAISEKKGIIFANNLRTLCTRLCDFTGFIENKKARGSQTSSGETRSSVGGTIYAFHDDHLSDENVRNVLFSDNVLDNAEDISNFTLHIRDNIESKCFARSLDPHCLGTVKYDDKYYALKFPLRSRSDLHIRGIPVDTELDFSFFRGNANTIETPHNGDQTCKSESPTNLNHKSGLSGKTRIFISFQKTVLERTHEELVEEGQAFRETWLAGGRKHLRLKCTSPTSCENLPDY